MEAPPTVSRTLPRLLLIHRLLAAGLVVFAVPLVVGLGAVADEQPVRVGEPAPRTILADDLVTVTDREASDNARAVAEQSVEPVLVFDRDAQTAIVRDVRSTFEATRTVREPTDSGTDGPLRTPSRAAQREALAALEPNVDPEVRAALVALAPGDLDAVERETIAIAQELARQRVTREQLPALLEDTIPIELALRSLPGDTGTTVVAPLLEQKMRPTVVVDAEATASARERAAAAVVDEEATWRAGEAVVREGAIVQPLQYQALEQLGVGVASPLRVWLRATLGMLMVTGVAGVYLSRMQPRVWVSGKKLILLGALVVAYAGLVVSSSALVEATSRGWLYAVPAGALAMLVALLIHPVIGIATMLPAAVLVLLVNPTAAPVALFAAAAVLVSVPLTTTISKRSDLRSATLRAGLSYPVLAAVIVAIFGPREELLVAIGAGALNGVVTAVVVQGALPYLESLFRLPTVTALLDLADRNHPLLRELEAKALGSYNHSVMVASLTERACRAVNADALLGSVAALYHDIGKVRQPHFFIENQQGIANPHDELEPEVSAVIIQNHVKDGVEMATEHRLPPEVVACIGSHHGTMLVSYFYNKALDAASEGGEAVEEDHFRYKGHKPRSKEAAILLLADCCEATTRAMAMSRGTLPREEIEATVARLLEERVDDGQFEASDLTFRELMTARDTIIESLVGIYHPRIAYPPKKADASDAGPDTAAGVSPEPARPRS